jgi:hypothetical protein
MNHDAYSPVGYIYRADQYCLDCIPRVIAGDSYDSYIQTDGCNCAEHMLDRIADDRPQPFDRMDERSFDSGVFPKAILYHNDQHAECGPASYGYGPEDPEWREQYCDSTCARCHDVIDGVSQLNGPDVCPVWLDRKKKGFQ